jgi:hypothetical protein
MSRPLHADADQVAELRDRARQDAGLDPRYVRPASPAVAPPIEPAEADVARATRLASGPQSGPGWHLEWAESAFTPGYRFQYVVHEGPLSPPWAGLDDLLVDRGYRSRESLTTPLLPSAPVGRSRAASGADVEPECAF